jgi:hypothetical protein
MAWLRIDDQFAFNPKVMAAGNEAAGVYVRALCYCCANRTDGFIPDEIAAMLTPSRYSRGRLAVWELLGSAHLVARVAPGDKFAIRNRKDSGRRRLPDVDITIKAHGYYIPDFLHYNWARTDERAHERADETADAAHMRAQNGAPPSRPVISTSPPPSSTPVTDPDGWTEETMDTTNILKEL